MSSPIRIAVAIGPRCLDATDLEAFRQEDWQGEFGDDVEVVSIELGAVEDLDGLWDCHGLIIISDGAYNEAGEALTISTVMEWCRRGGVLATVGASPFLLARSNGGIRSAIAVTIDIADTLIGYTASEAEVRVTDVGRRFLKEAGLPGTLVELNRGGVRSLVLNPIPGAVESLVETDRADTILGSYRVEGGWWIAWSAGARAAFAPTIRRGISSLLRTHLAARLPSRPAAIVDQLARADGDEDIVTVRCRELPIAQLVDQDSMERWDATQWHDGLARFRIPAAGVPRSLGLVSATGDPLGFQVVHPPSRRQGEKSTAPSEPADFDDFWAARLAELGRLPNSVAMDPFPEARRDGVDAYRVKFIGAGSLEITGILTRPRLSGAGASLLSLPGYAVGGLESHPWQLADRVTILSINVRNVGSNAEPPIDAEGLLTHRLSTPTSSGMVSAILDAVRAFDVLAALDSPRPRISLLGTSQGGALALAVGWLRPEAIAVASVAPFLVDIRRSYDVVSSEPYRELQRYADRSGEHRKHALAALDYVDAAHFLGRVQQSCLVVYSPDDDIAPARGIESWYGHRPRLDLRSRDGGHLAPAIESVREEVKSWLLDAMCDEGLEDPSD